MLPLIELLVSGNTSGSTSVGGIVDLYPGEEISITYSIKNVRDIASTTSTYSKNFQIPGTKNNNILFQNLFLIGADGSYDPRRKANCTLSVDSIPIVDGTIQVVSIDVDDRDKPIYSVTVFGATKAFNSAISGKFLTDFDFSELNHTLTIPNIVNTWSANPSIGYYYSIKDYGYDYDMKQMKGINTTHVGIDPGNMYPDVYHKYIVDKIFSAAGFSYQSNFFNSNEFKYTVSPYNNDRDTIMGPGFVSGRTFVASNTTYSAITISQMKLIPYANIPYSYAFEYPIRATTVLSGSAVSSGYSFSITGDSYTFDQPENGQFNAVVNFGWSALNGSQSVRALVGFKFYRSSYNNGTWPFWEDQKYVTPDIAGPGLVADITTPMTYPKGYGSGGLYPFAAGEKVWVALYMESDEGWVPPSSSNKPFEINSVSWKHIPSAQRSIGNLVNFDYVLPEKVLATDYLKSIFNMFNMYMEPHKTIPNKFIIEPFEDFYAQGTERNWTSKLDRSQKVTEKLISEDLARQYSFSYKEDKDFLNDDYKNSQKRVYGDFVYNIDNEFTTNEEKIEVLFSPTPVDNVKDSSIFVIPKMGKYDSNGKFGKTNFNPRFLRVNPTLTKLAPGEYFIFTGTTQYTSYPYAGHMNNPFTGTTDYNFGSVPYVYYPFSLVTSSSITTNNLFNVYWNKWLTEVTDKEAKMITAYFKLSPSDIAEFRFADKIYVEGLTSEGGHFFRINAIEYSPTSGKPAKVELLKVLNKYVNHYPSRRTWNQVGATANVGFSLNGGTAISNGTIAVGSGTLVNSPYTIAMGESNIIAPGSDGGVVIGNSNYVYSNNTATTIFGSVNTISKDVHNSTILGNFNNIYTGSTDVYIKGDVNNVFFASKAHVEGTGNTINSTLNTGLTLDIRLVGHNNTIAGHSTSLDVSGNLNQISNAVHNTRVIGSANTIGSFVTGASINGHGNILLSTGKTIVVNGEFNVLSGSNTGVTIYGNGNIVRSGANNVVINGFRNIISANTTNVSILSLNDLTTVKSNTVYAPNVNITNTLYLDTGSTLSMGGGLTTGFVSASLGLSGTTSGPYSLGGGLLVSAPRAAEFAMASQGNYGQYGTCIAQNQTVNNGTAQLFLSSSGDTFHISSGQTYYVRLYCVGMDVATSKAISYKGEGMFKNSSGTTTFTETVLTKVVAYDPYISATSFSVSANTSTSALALTVSGQTSSTLNWICQIDYTQINEFI